MDSNKIEAPTNEKKDDEKSRDYLEKEVKDLKKKIKQVKCQLQQTKSQMELQGLRAKQLIQAWQTRIADAEDKSLKYELRRDRELIDISSQLMFVQGQVKQEQQKIQADLSAKDATIAKQQEEILKLTSENKQLGQNIAVLTKRRRNRKTDSHHEFEMSLNSLTRYDSGLGFPNTEIASIGEHNNEFVEFQKAYDTIKRRYTTTDSFNSSGTNFSELTIDRTFSQDNVFDDSVEATHGPSIVNFANKSQKEFNDKGSYPDLKTNTGISRKTCAKKMSRIRRQSLPVSPSTELYANPNIIRKKKKYDSLPHKPKDLQLQNTADVKSRHMSLDMDLDRSFDSITFRGEKDEPPWYLTGDDSNFIKGKLENDRRFEFNSNDTYLASTESLHKKHQGSFFRDIFNTLRNKTIRKKRKRVQSAKMPTIFLSQSEPDIPHAEVNIDEAIYNRLKKKIGKT